MRWIRAAAVVLCVTPVLSVAAPAHAGVLLAIFASPSGTPADNCTKADPCDLATAIDEAASGSNVTILTGTYGSATAPLGDIQTGGTGMTIKGEAGKPTPVVYDSGTITIADQSTLSDLDVVGVGTGDGLITSVDSTLDHVRSIGAGCSGTGTISNSLCVTTAAGSAAVGAGGSAAATASLALINVDAIATAPSGIGIFAFSTGNSTVTITATNTIAMGAGSSVQAGRLDNGVATITLKHSAYVTAAPAVGAPAGPVTINADKTDVTAAPKFVDATDLNFTERPSSRTVDAGLTKAAVGKTDINGTPRLLAKAVDIGAYELAEPPVIKRGSATGHSSGSVSVTCKVNPKRLATTAQLVTTHHGTTLSSKPVSVGKGGKPTKVTLTLGELRPHTSYNVRIVATNLGGSTTTKLHAKTK